MLFNNINYIIAKLGIWQQQFDIIEIKDLKKLVRKEQPFCKKIKVNLLQDERNKWS